MGEFIARQPNGLLCRFSSIVECITDYNMTEEDYIEMCAEHGRQVARNILKHHIRPFELVTERFYEGEMSEEEFQSIIKEISKPIMYLNPVFFDQYTCKLTEDLDDLVNVDKDSYFIHNIYADDDCISRGSIYLKILGSTIGHILINDKNIITKIVIYPNMAIKNSHFEKEYSPDIGKILNDKYVGRRVEFTKKI